MKRLALVLLGFLSVAGSQTLRWVHRHEGFVGIARAVVCGAVNNIYAAGTCYDTLGLSQMTVVGLSPAGSRRWMYQRSGLIAWPSAPDFVSRPLACGTDGNLYVAGAALDTAGGSMEKYDFTVLSLTASGQERWVYNYAGPTDSGGFAQAVAQGVDGNVYAAGYCQVGFYDLDFAVVSLTSTGQQRWVYRYPGPAGYYEMATAVVCGADSNIYAAGFTGPDTAVRLTVVSLTPGGGVRWVYRHDSLGPGLGYVRALACGPDGSVYVAGVVWTAGGGADFAIVSLTQTGAERWVYRYNGTGNDNEAYAVAYGQDGNIYASGYSVGSDSAYDIAVVSLAPAGGERWTYRCRTYGGQGYDYPLALGTDGNVYVGGTSYTDSTSYDLTVLSLTQAGSERWVCRYNGPENHVDAAAALDFGADRNVYVAGMSGMQFTVISLNPASGIEGGYKPQASSFKPKATIVRNCLSLPEAVGGRWSAVGACLLDASGRKVMDLLSGPNDVSGLAPGVYFVKEAQAQAQAVRRVVIAR